MHRSRYLHCFDDEGRTVAFHSVTLESWILDEDASPAERRALAAIRYEPNHAVLHTDAALLPRERGLWSAWNYLSRRDGPELGQR